MSQTIDSSAWSGWVLLKPNQGSLLHSYKSWSIFLATRFIPLDMYNPPHPFHGFRGENIHIAHKCNRCKQLSGGITTVLFSKTSFFWKGATWMRMVLDCNYYIHFCPLSHLYLFYILISININRWAAYIILVAIAPCFFLISLPLCLVSCLFYQ